LRSRRLWNETGLSA
jgi:hypothetical protein